MMIQRSFLLGVLCGSATLPLVMVSATAPLVQGWFALIGHPRSSDPYFLYAASNAGSLLALSGLSIRDRAEPGLDHTKPSLEDRVSHPGDSGPGLRPGGPAIEPIAASLEARLPAAIRSRAEASPTLATWARWIVLVFIPASWLMGVTAYLTTDLASIPLMWIIPLALYLLSFILAFARSAAGLVRARQLVASLSRSFPSCWSCSPASSTSSGFPFI